MLKKKTLSIPKMLEQYNKNDRRLKDVCNCVIDLWKVVYPKQSAVKGYELATQGFHFVPSDGAKDLAHKNLADFLKQCHPNMIYQLDTDKYFNEILPLLEEAPDNVFIAIINTTSTANFEKISIKHLGKIERLRCDKKYAKAEI